MAKHKLISTDSHIIESPEFWTSRIEPKFQDRCPRLVPGTVGGMRWYADGLLLASVSGGAQAGVRFERPEQLQVEAYWEEVRPGAYEPEARLKDLDLDGVYGEIIHTTCGFHLFYLEDSELLSAIFRVYNDQVAEFTSGHRDRLKGIALVNVDDVEEGVQELQRVAKLGLAGALITLYPPEDRPFDSPIYDPFWAAAQDLGIPLGFHGGTKREPVHSDAKTPEAALDLALAHNPFLGVSNAHWVQLTAARMIFGGVFERFPKLKVGIVEHEMGWAPYMLWRMDYNYTQRARGPGYREFKFKDGALPSDFFHSNMFISFQEDPIGIRLRDVLGVDNMCWGSDYPHQESTFPKTHEILDGIMTGVPEDERERMTSLNAAKLYGFDVSGAS